MNLCCVCGVTRSSEPSTAVISPPINRAAPQSGERFEREFAPIERVDFEKVLKRVQAWSQPQVRASAIIIAGIEAPQNAAWRVQCSDCLQRASCPSPRKKGHHRFDFLRATFCGSEEEKTET